jgi:hypothetical protein
VRITSVHPPAVLTGAVRTITDGRATSASVKVR